MKYLAILAVPAVIYLVLARETPVAKVQEAIAQTEIVPLTTGAREVSPEAQSGLKRPLDRTQHVLKQVEARNGDGEF